MLEIALSATVVLLLLASAGGERIVAILFTAGVATIVLGMVTGVPAGMVYHRALFRALSKAEEAVPDGWWWHPTRFHERLSESARSSVMPWFRAGAAGFLLALTGCAMVLAALLAQ